LVAAGFSLRLHRLGSQFPLCRQIGINEQISVLQQCIDGKRKYNQLIKILGACEGACLMIWAINPVRNWAGFEFLCLMIDDF
jgi:hypothetical protein